MEEEKVVEKELEPEHMWGLNKKGFMYFVLLFIVFFPLSFLPWLSKSLRGKPKNPKVYHKVAIVYAGILVMFCLVGYFKPDLDRMNKKLEAGDIALNEKYNRQADYAEGYRAGYCFTQPTGEILTDESQGNFEGRLAQLNKSMNNADEAARQLALDYGGNKSKEWIAGCKEGFMDGLRNAEKKH